MFEMCKQYQALRADILATREKWASGSRARIETLNEFYDAQNALPPGVQLASVNPELAERGNSTLAECDAAKAARDAAMIKLQLTLRMALREIGQHYGNELNIFGASAVEQHFDTLWARAVEARVEHLDGVRVRLDQFDPKGPMFSAFATALSLMPNELLKRLEARHHYKTAA